MVLGLLTATLVSIVCLIAAIVIGFTTDPSLGIQQHFLFGFFTTFMVTLAQSMTMFYFIGMGKQVKDLVANGPMAQEFIPPTKKFKARFFPPSLWAMLFTMATMIVGGGVHTHVIPPIVHSALAAAALYFNLVAFWRGAKHMIEQSMLMQELEKRLYPSPTAE